MKINKIWTCCTKFILTIDGFFERSFLRLFLIWVLFFFLVQNHRSWFFHFFMTGSVDIRVFFILDLIQIFLRILIFCIDLCIKLLNITITIWHFLISLYSLRNIWKFPIKKRIISCFKWFVTICSIKIVHVYYTSTFITLFFCSIIIKIIIPITTLIFFYFFLLDNINIFC